MMRTRAATNFQPRTSPARISGLVKLAISIKTLNAKIDLGVIAIKPPLCRNSFVMRID